MQNLNLRAADLNQLRDMLKTRDSRKVDLVTAATDIKAKDGNIFVRDAYQRITMDGVTTVNGEYAPSTVALEGIAARLDIPTSYLKRIHATAPDMFDGNVNGWLHGKARRSADGALDVVRPADQRAFLLRTFTDHDGGPGILRSVQSDRYQIIDDTDALVAVLAGVRAAEADVTIDTCDLTDRNMYVRVHAPGIAALAPNLLAGYRSPFTDPEIEMQRNHGWALDRARAAARNEGLATAEPVVFAGFEIRNSEVGCGAWSIVPIITIKVCNNGLTFTREAFTKTHLGSRMEKGMVNWSDDTRRKNLDLITAQARDAVSTFLDVDYVTRKISELEKAAGVPISNADKAIRRVAKARAFTESEADGILDHFIRGGQMTAAGVMNAITSYSQTLANADRARHLDDNAVDALMSLAG